MEIEIEIKVEVSKNDEAIESETEELTYEHCQL